MTNHEPLTTPHGFVITSQGGRVVCRETRDPWWAWHCDTCGESGGGLQEQVREAAANHLRTRYSCAHPTR